MNGAAISYQGPDEALFAGQRVADKKRRAKHDRAGRDTDNSRP